MAPVPVYYRLPLLVVEPGYRELKWRFRGKVHGFPAQNLHALAGTKSAIEPVHTERLYHFVVFDLKYYFNSLN